ncbi:response regulator [Pseudoroseomonas cervicalis]|uniref:response regulator n=1 Tax=Teichococcus cervicalis TaxID=204525 RepID=UPI0022F1CB34|nr:response regulator [Pseudoroseomonas cervicalis]WBV43726.1 response regulator [Pseudoroseomonas cervicalis]
MPPASALLPDFQQLLRVAPHPYMVMDGRFTLVWANDAYLRVTGRSAVDILDRNIFDAFPGGPHDPGGEGTRQLRQSLETVLETRAPHTIALIRYAIPRGPDFEDRFWSATHTPLLGANGEVAFILQQTDDVTELQSLRQRAGEAEPGGPGLEHSVFHRALAVQQVNLALDAERTQLRRLVEQAPAFAAYLRGPQHVFEIANAAYLSLIGREAILGKTVREAMPELGGQPFFGILDEVFATGRAFIGRAMRARLHDPQSGAARRDGGGGGTREVFLDFVYQPILEPDGKVSGIFVLGYDVTEQTRVADELGRYKDQLEEMVRVRTRALEESEAERRRTEAALRQSQKMEAIGQLTGGVAHDFNNLLQILSGNLQMLQQAERPPEEARRIETALGAVERGAKLAAQLLAFARRQPLEPRPVNLGRLVREMDDLLRRALGEAIELETVIAGGLWNTLADPDQVQNALLNLAVNARDAMEGGGRLTIEAGNAMLDDYYALQHDEVKPGQYVMLAVSDTGCGIPPELLEKVFEPFFTTKREGRGTGLGLSMVYGFVKQSHGHIKIYSEAGQGTTVRLYLPRSHEAETVVAPLAGLPVEGGRETVLVVEDDPAVQATVVELLQDLGYTVLRCSDGQSALTLLRSGVSIDLLFTDVVMPGPVRAPELARQVQTMQPHAAVLFTSGYTENAIVHGGRLDPGVNLLSKPYRREDLARKVRQALHDRRQALAAAAVPHRPTASPAAAPAGRGLRVLLVEDDPLILMDSEDLLSHLGCQVVTARDARGALLALEKERFDLLFTDIGLPGISGSVLAQQARARWPGLRIIFASGYGGLDTPDMLPGAQFLIKPYGLRELEAALRQAALPEPG